MTACALSTIDNPFDPFDNFDEWFLYDVEKGHYSCGLLARIAKTSSALSDKENDDEIERAIDDIIKYDIENKYIKIKRDIEE